MNILGHLNTVNLHRFLVMQYCFRAGLYVQGLTHDLSKYSPVEFINGAKYYTGHASPNNTERKDKGISYAWIHHKGRNRHHYEYWTDYQSGGMRGCPYPVKMPERYVIEMLCDRIAACRTYNGKNYTCSRPLEYYMKDGGEHYIQEETGELLHILLYMVAKKGEDYTFRFLRHCRRNHISLYQLLVHRED